MTLPEDNFLHCYWVHGNQIDWNSAETVCENEGGTLVTILSSEENMLVLHLATQSSLFLGTGAVPTVFIGATDKKDLERRQRTGRLRLDHGRALGLRQLAQLELPVRGVHGLRRRRGRLRLRALGGHGRGRNLV